MREVRLLPAAARRARADNAAVHPAVRQLKRRLWWRVGLPTYLLTIPMALLLRPLQSWQVLVGTVLAISVGMLIGMIQTVPLLLADVVAVLRDLFQKQGAAGDTSTQERVAALARFEIALHRYPKVLEFAASIATPLILALMAALVAIAIKG